MITLMVDGVILDMAPISLSIKKENNAFTFGKLQLSRTQSFTIKKTGKNMSVLGRGDFVNFGEKERMLHDAYLYGSGINAIGKLYVDEVEDNFKCMFIFGDLLPLKEIANVKKMSEILEEYDVELYVYNSKNANADNLGYYDCVRYWNLWSQNAQYISNALFLPSFDVRKIFEYANNFFDAQFDLSHIPNYRLVQPPTQNAERENVTLSKDSIDVISGEENTKLMFSVVNRTLVNCPTGQLGDVNYIDMKCYATTTEGEITFPEDFPDDIFFIADYTHFESWSNQVVVDLLFLGGYEFDWETRVVTNISQEGERLTKGAPLAGRTIELPVLTTRTYYNEADRSQRIVVEPRLSFYRKSNFHNTRGLQYKGFYSDASPFTFTFPSVSRQAVRKYDEVNVNYYSWAQDNLPSMSFIELYNAIAFLQNKYITYNNGSITMQSLDFENVVYIQNVIGVENMERRGIIDAQKALIEWKYSDVVPEAFKKTIVYNTQNEMLEEEKSMFKIPFSCGEPLPNNDVFINDVKKDNYDGDWSSYNIIWQGNNHTIAIAGEGEMLKYVNAPYCEMLSQIQTNSTRITLTCQMSLLEYEKIKENNIIYYGNARWVWISSTWQKNKAKFVLQKI